MTAVVVVGGGLAGLVAARTVANSGLDVILIEANETVGGRVRSEHVDGFTLDRGFQVLFTAYPAVKRELDLGTLDLGSFRPGTTLCRPGSRESLADPFGDPGGLTDTLFNGELTLRDKLRLFHMRRMLGRQAVDSLLEERPTTIREYLAQRGFSDRCIENFVAPFYGGITFDRDLSTSSAVFRYTFKMIAEGRTAVPRAGMQAISTRLADRAREAGVRIECDCAVEGLDTVAPGSEEYEVRIETGRETLTVDGAVVATDPASARELTGVDGIPTDSNASVTQHFSLPETQSLHARHPLLLNAADPRPNQVAIMTDAATEYAPQGKQLLSATFVGGQSDSDDELADEVRSSLEAWFPENRFANLELLRTDRIAHAQHPQPPGFLAARPGVGAPAGPVVLAGDYTRWASIQGALESGTLAAETLTSSL